MYAIKVYRWSGVAPLILYLGRKMTSSDLHLSCNSTPLSPPCWAPQPFGHFGQERDFLSLLGFEPWVIHLYLSHCTDYTVNCHPPVLFMVYQVLSPHESIGQGMKLTARLHLVHAWENVWNWASASAYALWHASVQPLIVL